MNQQAQSIKYQKTTEQNRENTENQIAQRNIKSSTLKIKEHYPKAIKPNRAFIHSTPQIEKRLVSTYAETTLDKHHEIENMQGKQGLLLYSKKECIQKAHMARFHRHISKILDLKIKLQGNSANHMQFVKKVYKI